MLAVYGLLEEAQTLLQHDPNDPTAKANIARYRGAACGVKYAEALWAMNAHAVEIL